MTSFVVFDMVEPHIAKITLQSPNNHHAFSQKMLYDFEQCLQQLENQHDIRVCIVTGEGKAFCAGADLKERALMSEESVLRTVNRIRFVINRLEEYTFPSIAAVNGFAFGGGLELALGCDLIYGAQSATVGLTEVKLGIIPGAGGTQRLVHRIGEHRTKEMLFTSRHLSSEEAKEYGLFLDVFHDDVFMEEILTIARRIVNQAPLAVRSSKMAVHNARIRDRDAGLLHERACYNDTLWTEDRKEGLRAFIEKRTPHYKGE